MGEEGLVMLIVMFLIIIMGMMIMALAGSSLMNYRLVNNLYDNKKALYAAEAGIAMARYYLESSNGDFKDTFKLSDDIYCQVRVKSRDKKRQIISNGYYQEQKKLIIKEIP